jgi:hypothetical protein
MAKKLSDFSAEDRGALAAFLGEFAHDPVGFVWAAFPWGEGELEGQSPQEWQLELLEDIKDGLKDINTVIREVRASGNGIGKSALVSWLILWSLGTFEDTKGVVTANTDTQLRTKTWAELAKWHRLFIGNPLFDYTATSLYSSDPKHEKTWRIDAIPWSEQNPEAFAGLHNQGRRILIIFDEASAIADVIWETVEGATTDKDTEIIWCAFGNPTRPSGRFFDCFNKFRNFWHHKQIDSRTVRISNKQQLNEWVDAWGIDSDFVKVHVLGEFPNAAANQLISRTLVDEAVKRGKAYCIDDASDREPVIIGCDPAWTGEDTLIVYLRKGNFTKVLWELKSNNDDTLVAEKLAYFQDEYGMSKGFIDQGYGTGIYSVLRSMGRNDAWQLVPFASKPTDEYYANKRAEMWCEMKKWLQDGGALESKPEIVTDLTGPEAAINRRGKLQLESKDDMKRRGLASPNYGDALALTFAQPVMLNKRSRFNKMRREGKIRKFGSM